MVFFDEDTEERLWANKVGHFAVLAICALIAIIGRHHEAIDDLIFVTITMVTLVTYKKAQNAFWKRVSLRVAIFCAVLALLFAGIVTGSLPPLDSITARR